MKRATRRFAEHHTWCASIFLWRAGPGHLQTMSPHHQNGMFPLEQRARPQWLEQIRLWRTRISDEMHVATISGCLSRLCAGCCTVCSNLLRRALFVVPILQARGLRLCQAKWVCHCHVQSWDVNPGSLAPEPTPWITTPCVLPPLYKWKLRHRKAKWCAQGHTAG